MPTQRARHCPERPVHLKHGAERYRQLEMLDDVDMFEHLICHSVVVLARILDTRHITQSWNWNKAKHQFGRFRERDG